MLIEKEMQELEAAMGHFDKSNSAISAAPVSWHLDHILRANSSICKALLKSEPQNYKWRFNWVRNYIMIRGSIPRGKGKAPKVSVAQEPITLESVEVQFKTAQELLVAIEKLSPKHHFPHPYFGDLNLKQSRWFLKVHTLHHLKIIREIIAA